LIPSLFFCKVVPKFCGLNFLSRKQNCPLGFLSKTLRALHWTFLE